MTRRTDDGGPAFPSPGYDATKPGGPIDGEFAARGMSLRDYFAGQALAGIDWNLWFKEAPGLLEEVGFADSLARGAYKVADAMLAARKE